MPDRITVSMNTTDAIEDIHRFVSRKRRKIKGQIQRSAFNVQRNTKQETPVDTGRLRSSYVILFKSDGLGAEVGSNVEYAPYVEFGTGLLVEIPAGLESYAAQFKGKGIKQVNLPARPHLFPSYEKERPALIKKLRDLLGRPE